MSSGVKRPHDGEDDTSGRHDKNGMDSSIPSELGPSGGAVPPGKKMLVEPIGIGSVFSLTNMNYEVMKVQHGTLVEVRKVRR